MTLTFDDLELECTWDYLYVFDGDSMETSPLIGAFTGQTHSQRTIVAHSGKALIYFYSDYGYTMGGFR